MAIDTREKRASVVGVGSVWSPPSVQAGTAGLDAEDRQIVGWSYAGIAVATGPAPPPVLASLSPPWGPPGTPVVLTGSHFGAAQGGNLVYFGAVPAAVTAWADSVISCLVPALPAGQVQVAVAMAVGTSNTMPFMVEAGPEPPPGPEGYTVRITRGRWEPYVVDNYPYRGRGRDPRR